MISIWYAVCGRSFPLVHHIGKPVLMLDAARRITGEASYDPFGQPNRVTDHAGTAHPYADSASSELARWTQVPGSGMQVRQRVRLSRLETQGEGSDYVSYWDAASGAALLHQLPVLLRRPDVHGFHQHELCRRHRRLRVPAHQTGAQPFWTPLRFPDQYADAETDLFENWNRYDDPSTGRYLQPTPVLAVGSVPLPAYAYALNNPLHYTDSTGNIPDSPRAHAIASLARGDVNGAMQAYLAATGTIPVWLSNLDKAYGAANQVAGACYGVAHRINTAFLRLGVKAEIYILRPADGSGVIGIEKIPGVASSTVQISNNGQHVIVAAGGRIYDAFTGPQGQTTADYFRRIFKGTGAGFVGMP